jgi:acyl-ACP thioesterase
VDIAVPASEFVAPVPGGRAFTRRRHVHLGDVTTTGRIRLDALARYVQDVAVEDVDEVGMRRPWVLRRLAMQLGALPMFHDDVELVTWCSGAGGTFAERRTTLLVDGSVRVEAVALWVYVDSAGRPARLEGWFFDVYGVSVKGRRVNRRLVHPAPPQGAAARSWPLRAADFDVLEHLNNAATWIAIEDEFARYRPGRVPVRAEMEYRAPVDPGDEVVLRTMVEGQRLCCWLTSQGEVRASAVVEADPAD